MGLKFNPFTGALDQVAVVNQGDFNDLFIDANGNVGIGTSSPSQALHVAGNGLFVGTSTSNITVGSSGTAGPHTVNVQGGGASADYGYALFTNRVLYANTATGGDLFINPLSNTGAIRFLSNNGGNERLRITSTGNVGIGTVSPQQLLHVHNSSAADARLKISNSTTGSAQYDGFELSCASTGVAGIIQWEQQPIYFYTHNGSAVDPRLVITAAGNVGIGTTLPVDSLQVMPVGLPNPNSTGSEITGSSIGVGQNIHLQEKQPDGAYTDRTDLAIITNTGYGLGESEKIRITSSGNVGIGTTNVNYRLSVNAGAANSNVAEFTGTATGRGLLISTSNDGGVNDDSVHYNVQRGSGSHIFEVAGSEKLRIDSSGRLLVGTLSWSGTDLLAVKGQVGSSAGSGQIAFGRGSFQAAADQPVANIKFVDFSADENQYAFIQCNTDASGTSGTSTAGRLVFSTTADGASSPTPRMTIKNDGNVGIGTTSPQAVGHFHTTSTSGNLIQFSTAQTGATSADGSVIGINTFDELYLFNRENSAIRFGTAGTERLRITNTGAIQLRNSPGIDFSQIQTNAAGSTSETLDSYEEGTWTPTIAGTTTAGTGTYSVQSASYTKIGRLVFATGTVTWSAHTGTGNMRIAGLPFSSVNATELTNAASFTYVSNVTTIPANAITTGGVFPNDNKISLYTMVTGGGTMAGLAMSSTGNMYFSVSYQVA